MALKGAFQSAGSPRHFPEPSLAAASEMHGHAAAEGNQDQAGVGNAPIVYGGRGGQGAAAPPPLRPHGSYEPRGLHRTPVGCRRVTAGPVGVRGAERRQRCPRAGPARPRRSLTSTGNRTRPTVNTARAHVTARPRPGPAPRAARPRRPPIGGRAVVDHIRSGTTKPRATVGRPRASLNERRELRKQSGACWELWSERGQGGGTA